MENPEFLFNIVTTSGVPIYRQLMDQIKTMIASGRLKSLEFLPSIRQVGKELEVNPMTVSKAYAILEREGILENVRGEGVRVADLSQARKNFKSRKKSIEPLLEQVINSARQLSLAKKDAFETLNRLWKEK